MSSRPDPESPVPFADDPECDPALRDLFGAARRDRPAIRAGEIAAHALTPSVLPKIAAATLALTVGAIVVAALAWPRPVVPAPRTPAIEAVEPVTAVVEPVEPQPIAPAETVPSVVPMPPPEGPAEARTESPTPNTGAVVLPPAPPPERAAEARSEAPAPNEGAILLRARRALAAGDDATALAAVAEHEANFARGTLAPEREAIAIDALSRAGRSREARARAERFLSRWPDSAYADRARHAITPE